MNNDHAATRSGASEEDRAIKLPLTIIQKYYCDKGIHSGMQYVKLDGYLTPEQAKLLNSLIGKET